VPARSAVLSEERSDASKGQDDIEALTPTLRTGNRGRNMFRTGDNSWLRRL
jgi:hypothetical protein